MATRRQDEIDAFLIKTEKREYIVTLEPLRNDTNGNPRFQAVIVFYEPDKRINSYYNAVYKFTGHYLGRRGEAEWITKYHEEYGHNP